LILGVLLLDAVLDPDPPHDRHCGTCTRCLNACPTRALRAPGLLDAARCIATWNLEQKGDVSEDQWPAVHGWAAGCDICQEVCPFNAPARTPPGDEETVPPLPWQSMSLSDAIGMDRATFERAFRSSALRRTGWKGVRLGAITAAGSERLHGAREALHACLEDPDAHIRARAAWALQRLAQSTGP
jgi:epoxyqueuosine reductase